MGVDDESDRLSVTLAIAALIYRHPGSLNGCARERAPSFAMTSRPCHA
jgi:hypothetical protein